MDSMYPSQATSGLSEYQAINTVLFIILILIGLIALVNIIRFSNHTSGKHIGPLKAKFIELEDKFRWRRVKVLYLVLSAVVILTVIGTSYGTDVRAPLQTLYDFEVERAKDRMGSALLAIVTILFLWGAYFLVLPIVYRSISKTGKYLGNPEKNNSK